MSTSKKAKPKSALKNVKAELLGSSGRVHMQSQDLKSMSLRRFKGLKKRGSDSKVLGIEEAEKPKKKLRS